MKSNNRQKIPQAYELYCEGKSLQEISSSLGVSLEELSSWRQLCSGSPKDWSEGRKNTGWSPSLWLDKKIRQTMYSIDRCEESEQKALRDCLDDYISMKKKHESSIDRYGETKRVMEDFIVYTKEEFRESLPLLKDIIEAYIRYVGR